MKKLSYIQAEQTVLEWNKNDDKSPFVVAFVDSQCVNCANFEDFAVDTIENHDIQVITVDLRENKDSVAFPPMQTPTIFWYFTKDAPPLVKRGVPPSEDVLIDLIKKVLKVNRGESTIEDEFF
jgi:hypothetical protein